MGPWMPINEGALDATGMYVFASKDGTFLFASGSQKDSVMKDYPQLTACRLFCEAPPF
jgi:hypothetical protein